MFNKKKKKPQISLPSNFEHRVHTGFDKREGRYTGLPLQWASIVGNNQILKSTNRPLPLVDPSEITFTEILDLKTIVRPHFNNNKIDDLSRSTLSNVQAPPTNGIQLPKTSHVARSNSLRSSSPPRIRRDLRSNANVPPSVPEEQILMQTQQQPPLPATGMRPLSMHQNPNATSKANIPMRPQQQPPPGMGEWNRPMAATPGSQQFMMNNDIINGNQQYHNGAEQQSHNGNSMTAAAAAANPIAIHTELSAPFYR